MDAKLKLQIKDAGAWRHLVSFNITEQVAVCVAAAGMLRSLRQPQTVMRVTCNAEVLSTCAAPDFLWLLK
jgi:hypothetical protein